MYTTINQLAVSLNILPTRTVNFNIAVCLPRNSTLFKSESHWTYYGKYDRLDRWFMIANSNTIDYFCASLDPLKLSA